MGRLIGLAVALLILGAAAFWGVTSPAFFRLVRGVDAQPAANRTPNLDNGRTLFLAGGCASCHAQPGQPDETRLSGGLALASPFGTFHIPNLSPHERDGIGRWSETDFIRAMREGVSPDGRHYYPAFPYTSYQRMSDADFGDLFAYLRSLPALEGRVRDHELPFPYTIRRGLGLWKLAFLDGRRFGADPAKTAIWNRGAALIEGPGHCAECHSLRNALGAVVADRRYAGGPDPEGKGDAVPNITPHATGAAGWTPDEMAEFLATGRTPLFSSVGGSMRAVIRNTSKLAPDDRAAMAEYLVSLPPREGWKAPK